MSGHPKLKLTDFPKLVEGHIEVCGPDGDDEFNLEREGIVEEFDGLAADENATQQDFNYVMQSLYDWGDRRMDSHWNGKKVCWIDTMSAVPSRAKLETST